MNSSSHTHDPYRLGTKAGSTQAAVVDFIKTNAVMLGTALTLVSAGAVATWHVTARIHQGDLDVRQSVYQAESRVREDIGQLRGEVSDLRNDIQANYRDLRDRLEDQR